VLTRGYIHYLTLEFIGPLEVRSLISADGNACFEGYNRAFAGSSQSAEDRGCSLVLDHKLFRFQAHTECLLEVGDLVLGIRCL